MIGSVQSVRVFRHVLLVTALCLVTFFAGLGRSAIGDADEAFYAQSAREMVDSGDWITPHYNYEYRFQKPVFFYWLVAAAYVVAGIGETAARFPSALAGLAIALMTWAVGRRWVGPSTGVVGGAIVATSFGYFTIAHASLPDLPLAAFITLATWALFEAGAPVPDAAGQAGAPGPTSVAAAGGTASTAPDDRARRRWVLLAGAAIGFGMLTKGPVALVLPVLVYLVARLVMADGLLPTRRGWFGLRWLDVALAAVVLLAVGLPWFLAMADVHGIAYLRRFFVGENLERFATERYNGRRPLWFYAPIIIGGLAPWSSLMALWFPPLGRVLRGVRRLTELEWRLILWAVVPVVFYTLSVGQQPRYILPVLPPLAVLVARTLVSRLAAAEAAGRRDRGVAIAITVSAVAFLALAFLLFRARPLLFALSPLQGQVGTAIIAIAAVGLLGWTWFGRQRRLPAAVAAAAAATLVTLQFTFYSGSGPEPVQRMAREIQQLRRDEPSGTYRVFVRNLVFYTGVKQTDLVDEGQAIEFLRQPQRVFVVMPLKAMETLQRDHGLQLHQLRSIVYFNPSAVRLRTLLSNNPQRLLDTVVLVSNRP
jgi:4-amino-4-deoxy-L-arabinose transferase-like glycosyltransferase